MTQFAVSDLLFLWHKRRKVPQLFPVVVLLPKSLVNSQIISKNGVELDNFRSAYRRHWGFGARLEGWRWYNLSLIIILSWLIHFLTDYRCADKRYSWFDGCNWGSCPCSGNTALPTACMTTLIGCPNQDYSARDGLKEAAEVLCCNNI